MPFDGTQLDEVTQVILKARDLLAKGWCTRRRSDTDGRSFCAVGALSYVATGNAYGLEDHAIEELEIMQRLSTALTPEQVQEATRELKRVKFAGTPRSWQWVIAYNDSQTSVEPILEWFDRAAALGAGAGRRVSDAALDDSL